MYIDIYSRLITDWSVENINLDVTQYMMLLDVSVLPKKKDTTNVSFLITFWLWYNIFNKS